MRRIAAVAAWLLPLLFCPRPAATAQDRPAGIAELVERARRDSGLNGGRVGISLRSVKADRLLFEENASEPLILGSNAKILTTAAALARLGPDFRFQTVAGLEGNELHVFGGGDPNISGRFADGDPTAVFREWSKKLAEAGVRRLDAIVLHAGLFDREYLHPDWIAEDYDEDKWWCAPVAALSLNDNCVDLIYEGAPKADDPVRVTVRPDTRYVTIRNRARTVASNPRPFGFVRKDGTNTILAGGELKVSARPRVAWVAVEDPVRFFGTVLQETLERSGIPAGGLREDGSLLKDHPDLKIVAVHESDLASAVRVCNSVSQNFHAEMICKLLGAKLKEEGSTKAGLEAIREFLENDVHVSDATPADGSGLSRRNRASAASVVALLDLVRRESYGDVFRDSLAVSGQSGTLRKRMASIRGAVRAKTGHIDRVSALSGYLETASGDTIVFSIVCNDWKKGNPNRFQDRLLELLHARR